MPFQRGGQEGAALRTHADGPLGPEAGVTPSHRQ